MKFNRHERRLLWFAFRAGYIEAHTQIQGGSVPVGFKPGDSPETVAKLFAENVVNHAEYSAQQFLREAEAKGIPS